MRAEDIALLGLDDDDDDEVLALLGDDDELGANPFTRLASRARGGSARSRARGIARSLTARRRGRTAAIRQTLRQPLPGVSSGGARQYPLGFPVVQFVNAGATTLATQSNPQRPFKGNRLTIVVVRTAGAAGIAVTLDTFFVGQNSQLVDNTPLPAEMFAPTSFDNPIAMSDAEPGIIIRLTFTVSAGPAVNETVTVSCGIMGITLG